MKLSQKRNCNGCKGGWWKGRGEGQVCDMGVSVKTIALKGVPEEPCYKPLTNNERMEARRLILAQKR